MTDRRPDARGGNGPGHSGPGHSGPGHSGPGGGPGITVSARGLGVARDGRAILADIDLDIPAGALLAVTGPSGSGKSTLLAVVAGLITPTVGMLTHDGRPPAARADPAGGRVGLVLQGHGLVAVLTARENVELPLQIAGTARSQTADRARRALETVGLGDAGDRLTEELSGGQQQRVALARALVVDPALLVADEPTAELDPETATGILDVLGGQARDRGATVLIATHDPAVAASCDGALALVDGRLSAGRTDGRPR